MKKTVRILCTLLAALLLLSACGGANGNTATEAQSTEPAAPEGLVIYAQNAYTMPIVRDEYAEKEEIQASLQLKNALKDKFGTEPTLTTDYMQGTKRTDILEVEGPEILVGVTNRKISHDLLDTLGKHEYVVKADGDKLVIVGQSVYAAEAGVRWFVDTYVTPAADTLAVPADLEEHGVYVPEVPALAEGTILRYWSWNLGCGVGVNEEVTFLMEQYLPDIIGLQECNYDSAQAVTAFLRKHPEYRYVRATHRDGIRNYTPILYNSDVLRVLTEDSEWLRSRYTGTNTKSLSWAVFAYGEQKFAVINFHGAVVTNGYKGYETKTSAELSEIGRVWRLDNAAQLIEVKDRIVEKFGQIPVCINGDCNFNSTGDAYKVLTDGGFYEAELTAETKIRAGYKTSYSYGNAVPGAGKSIDHIFGINGVYFGSFDTVRESPAVTASDHVAIYTDFNPFGKGN